MIILSIIRPTSRSSMHHHEAPSLIYPYTLRHARLLEEEMTSHAVGTLLYRICTQIHDIYEKGEKLIFPFFLESSLLIVLAEPYFVNFH
jgi:hypothetical protein